jgi:hypothetical protein
MGWIFKFQLIRPIEIDEDEVGEIFIPDRTDNKYI